MKNVVLSFLTIMIIAGACRKTSPLACSAWALEISDEATALSNTANAYGSDPTPENCRAYRNALQNYVDELDRFRGCTFSAVDRQSWEEFIQDSQQSIDDLNC